MIQVIRIYKITNRLNGKLYVGQTKHSIRRRYSQAKNISCYIELYNVTTHTSKERTAEKDASLNHDKSKLLADYRNLNGNNRQAVNVLIALFLNQQTDSYNFSSNMVAM